jgi:hypothetical protein
MTEQHGSVSDYQQMSSSNYNQIDVRGLCYGLSMDGEVELLGERIAEQAAHLDAATHRLLADLREFNERGGWYAQGARSCAHWLSWRVGWDLGTARQHVRVACKLGEFPATDDALRRGELSYSKVRAILRVATPANEAMLLEVARMSTAAEVEKLARKYAQVQAHGKASTPRDDEQRRYVRRRDTEDGMVKIEAVLHPDEAELVWAMLDHAAKQCAREPVDAPASVRSVRAERTNDSAETHHVLDVTVAASPALSSVAGCEEAIVMEIASRAPGSPISPLRQAASAARRAFHRADGLLAVTQAYLRGDRANRAPVEVMVTIPLSELRGSSAAAREDATHPAVADPIASGCMGSECVSAETVRRLSCDAGVVECVEDAQGVPLSVGRKRRTIAGSLKRALLKRDTTCTFPGCAHSVFLEGHHIQHWADGGDTSLENGLLLCSHHHRHVHEYGYQVELGPDHRPQFRDPRGRIVPAVPERYSAADLGWPRIRAANAGLGISAETIACEWNGKPMPYANVVDQLVTTDKLN